MQLWEITVIKKVDFFIFEWVKIFRLELPQEKIVRSFKKCVISNEMDVNEDNVIFENDDNDDTFDTDDIYLDE